MCVCVSESAGEASTAAIGKVRSSGSQDKPMLSKDTEGKEGRAGDGTGEWW